MYKWRIIDAQKEAAHENATRKAIPIDRLLSSSRIAATDLLTIRGAHDYFVITGADGEAF